MFAEIFNVAHSLSFEKFCTTFPSRCLDGTGIKLLKREKIQTRPIGERFVTFIDNRHGERCEKKR